MRLETRAMAWLRFEKRCPMVLFERSPSRLHGRPDVLGITSSRYMLEIEVKRSISDFRANAKKLHIANRDVWIKSAPRQFWYLVPENLVKQVSEELPDWAGLLTIGINWGGWLKPVVNAPVNKLSRRIGIKSALKLVQLQTNQLWAAERDLDTMLEQRRDIENKPYGVEYTI